MCIYIYVYNYTIRYYHPGKIIINIAMENHGCLAMEIFAVFQGTTEASLGINPKQP